MLATIQMRKLYIVMLELEDKCQQCQWNCQCSAVEQNISTQFNNKRNKSTFYHLKVQSSSMICTCLTSYWRWYIWHQHSSLSVKQISNMFEVLYSSWQICVIYIQNPTQPVCLTFSRSLLGIFFPLNFLRNSCPNFCRLEKAHSADSCVPSISSSLSPYMAMLKLKPGDGSAAENIQ